VLRAAAAERSTLPLLAPRCWPLPAFNVSLSRFPSPGCWLLTFRVRMLILSHSAKMLAH